MINANELRIGNWVEDFGDGYGKVEAIFGENVGSEDVLTTANTVPQPIETFSPIPLTPDILLACGIERTGNLALNLWWRIGDVYLKNLNDGFEIIINDFSISKLKNLHQLQNLYFALTGTELVYNPSK